ncbi:hypothetical protein BV22DRAFT_1093424 [Leucogyrophana mollusca]|uniref:Uncharacterized protein n=1 Tax=Leucogyrophana mollusca TaxID=85980 RepID=A0ACB8BE94_9AGAM|nr:hypothetical protein BV22DRAFT_1093424 [Leucogyrophana mollusca]
MSRIIYVPSPYAFTGLSFLELPPLVQHYLTNVARLVPSGNCDVDALQDERSRLSLALFRGLQGVDIALVDKRHEAYAAFRESAGNISPSAAWFEIAAKQDEERIKEILGVLLPERQRILDEFMLKFDSLVWLDTEGHEDFGVNDWQAYRDSLCEPVLDYTHRALRALDEAVTKKNMENGGPWRAPLSAHTHPNSGRPQLEQLQKDAEKRAEHAFRDIRNSASWVNRRGPDSDPNWRTGRTRSNSWRAGN